MNRLKLLYEFALLAGLFGAVYLYGFAFDDFSETELVRLSYLWVGAVVFGAHGLIGIEGNALVAAGEAATHREALPLRRKAESRTLLSRFSSLLLWSYLGVLLVVDGRRPFLTAVMAAALWLVALAFFFETIFPEL